MKKNTFVIGDIHGCYHTMRKLIAKLPKDAELVFVGDLCDSGLYTKEVIEYIIDNNHKCVLGNHDKHMNRHLKDALKGEEFKWNTTELYAGNTTVESYKNCDEDLINKHLEWIDHLPPYIQIGEYFITHGFGLPYYQRRDIKKYQFPLRANRLSSMEYQKGWEEGYEDYDVINIFGHDSFDKVARGKNYYGIDTGCKYGKKLTAIELGSMKTIDVDVEPIDLKTEGKIP